jgi:hypothetical protein
MGSPPRKGVSHRHQLPDHHLRIQQLSLPPRLPLHSGDHPSREDDLASDTTTSGRVIQWRPRRSLWRATTRVAEIDRVAV